MITLPLGFFFIFAVLFYSLTGIKAEELLNTHTIVIVVLGTVAVFMLATPLRNILGVIRSVYNLRKLERKNSDVIGTILTLAKDRQAAIDFDVHPLLNYARDLWTQGVDPQLFEILVTQKVEELNSRSEQPVVTMKTIAKYPPALGMTGTVIGMISLFGNLSPENKHNIGPSLALAMTATFFGLALANFLILPLADRLHIRHLGRLKRNEIIYHSILLINRNEPYAVIENCHRVYRSDGTKSEIAA